MNTKKVPVLIQALLHLNAMILNQNWGFSIRKIKHPSNMLSLEFLPSYSLSTLFLHATLTTREQEILLSSLLYLSFSSSTTKLKESVGTGLMTTSVCQSRSAFKIDGRFYAGKTINLQICKYKYRYFCNFVYLVLFDTPPIYIALVLLWIQS